MFHNDKHWHCDVNLPTTITIALAKLLCSSANRSLVGISITIAYVTLNIAIDVIEIQESFSLTLKDKICVFKGYTAHKILVFSVSKYAEPFA
jgi:hypothetical protein